MTSTTFSYKVKQGRSFFLWSLFTGKTTMIIYLSLLTFFSMVISVFGFGISFSMPKEANEVWKAAAMFEMMIVQTLAFVFTFVFSIKEFSYLHDKRKTDMFGALPAARRTIFFSKLAAVIVQGAVPMLLIMAFLAIMNGEVTNYFSFSIIFEMNFNPEKINLWYIMLKEFMGVVANAVFLGFLSICCGKTVDKILSYIIINAAYPIAALLLQSLPASFVVGYNMDINEFLTCAFSPYTATTSINPIYWGIFSIALGVLCFFLLPRRKAECAQSHFAFKAPLIITKLLVSTAAGMVVAYMFGFIFSVIGGDVIAFIIGWILGSFTAYFLIQIIFAKGFKGFGWGMIPYAGLAVFFGILMLLFNTGLLGFESYVPKIDEIESVSLASDDMFDLSDTSLMTGKITDSKDIAECVEGHKEIIKYCQSQQHDIMGMTFGSIYDTRNRNQYDSSSSNVVITYTLKNGMTVKRNYGYLLAKDIKFLSTDTYKNYTNNLFLIDAEHISEIEIETINTTNTHFEIDEAYFNNKAKRIELANALKSDIKTYGYDDNKEICSIYFSFDSDKMHWQTDENIYVRSNYKKTIDLLKKSGESTYSGTGV